MYSDIEITTMLVCMCKLQSCSVFLAAFWFVISNPAPVRSTNTPGAGKKGSGSKKENKERRGGGLSRCRRVVGKLGCAHITGQLLIVLHQLLILLVDSQHLADPVGRRLCLDDEGEGRNSVRNQTKVWCSVHSSAVCSACVRVRVR